MLRFFFLWNTIAAQGWITKLCLNGVERSPACSIPEQKYHYVENNINPHLSDFSPSVLFNDWWDRFMHTAQLENLCLSDTLHNLFWVNVKLDITIIFHSLNRTTAYGFLLAWTQSLPDLRKPVWHTLQYSLDNHAHTQRGEYIKTSGFGIWISLISFEWTGLCTVLLHMYWKC